MPVPSVEAMVGGVISVVRCRCRREGLRLCWGSIDAETKAEAKMKARLNERKMVTIVLFVIKSKRGWGGKERRL